MPAASLPASERQLEACLIELEILQRSRPSRPTALVRAETGRRIDELYQRRIEPQEEIDSAPVVSLQDAVAKRLCRGVNV